MTRPRDTAAQCARLPLRCHRLTLKRFRFPVPPDVPLHRAVFVLCAIAGTAFAEEPAETLGTVIGIDLGTTY